MDRILDFETIRFIARPILSQHNVASAGLFGSYARGEAKSGSDVDILVRFSETPSLLELIGIEQELSEKLGKQVDLVTEGFLSPYFKATVLKQVKNIL